MRRFVRLLAVLIVMLVAAGVVVIGSFVIMPGHSYSGALPPLTQTEQDSAKRLQHSIEILAGALGARSLTSAPEHLEVAAQHIESELRQFGYQIETQEYAVTSPEVKETEDLAHQAGNTAVALMGKKSHNIIATLKGSQHADEIIVVGAHYDSVFDCPAADDNASGVATLLELARTMAKESPGRTIRFVAFTNEEPPFFRSPDMGSTHYADLCASRKEKIVAMLALETLGYYSDEAGSQKYPGPIGWFYPDKGNFLAFVGNLDSSTLVHQCVGAFRESTKFPSEGLVAPELIPGIDFSDQLGFWQNSYPGVMVTDTAFLRNPFYHTQNDTADKVDYDKLARIQSGLLCVVRKLAQ